MTPSALRTYDRAGSRGMPAVVPIRGAKCGGCHLKVSSGTESAARGKDPDAEFSAERYPKLTLLSFGAWSSLRVL